MAVQVTTAGLPQGLVVTSAKVRYLLIKNSSQSRLEMWKNSGSGWSNVGTNPTITGVHGASASSWGLLNMALDSEDNLQVVSLPYNTGTETQLAHSVFDTSSDSWGSWTEIGQWTGSYYTYNQWITVICDSNDKVWVGWGESDAAGYERCLVTTNVTGSWATTEISADYATERNLYIQADANDYIHAFWYDYTNIGWSYRLYTPGSGWGSQNPYSTGSRRYLYSSNVVEFDSKVIALAATSGSVYVKDKAGTVYAATFSHDPSYDYVFHTVLAGKMHAVCSYVSGSYNVLRIMEYTGPWGGTAYSYVTDLTTNTANVTIFCVAHDTLYQYYEGVEVAYYRSDGVYYDIYTWFTADSDSINAFLQGPLAYPVDDNQAAYLAGGIGVNDSQSAYLDFAPLRTSMGGAWMNGYSTEVQRSSQPVYLFADMNENAKAYTEGEGLWPFSYDWSGDDDDSWDPMYWVTDDS